MRSRSSRPLLFSSSQSGSSFCELAKFCVFVSITAWHSWIHTIPCRYYAFQRRHQLSFDWLGGDDGVNCLSLLAIRRHACEINKNCVDHLIAHRLLRSRCEGTAVPSVYCVYDGLMVVVLLRMREAALTAAGMQRLSARARQRAFESPCHATRIAADRHQRLERLHYGQTTTKRAWL